MLGARNAAYDRAAQAHTGNVYTALTGALSADPAASVGSVVAASGPCDAAGEAAPGFGWNDPGGAVSSCTIAEGAGGDFAVTATSGAGNTFVNGQP